MQVKEIVIPYHRPDTIRVYPIGDVHGGTKHCAEEKLQRQIKKIKDDPYAYWIDMADKCEFIAPSDPRWDSGAIADWVHPDNVAVDESEWYMDMFSPIKDKCLGLLEGNHELSIKRHSHIDVQKNICEGMGLDNLGYACFIRLCFTRGGRNSIHFTGFFTHGAGCAITAGAKLIRLQRLMDNFDADIVASGHVHDIVTYTKPYMTLDKENHIKQRVKVGAMTGCWFRTYTEGVSSSYGEQKNFPPVTLGCPVFTIIPDKGILKVEG